MMASPLPISQWRQIDVAATVSGEVESQLLPILTPVSVHPIFRIYLHLMIRFECNQTTAGSFLRCEVGRE